MFLGIFLQNPRGVLVGGPNCCRLPPKNTPHGRAGCGFFFIAQRLTLRGKNSRHLQIAEVAVRSGRSSTDGNRIVMFLSCPPIAAGLRCQCEATPIDGEGVIGPTEIAQSESALPQRILPRFG